MRSIDGFDSSTNEWKPGFDEARAKWEKEYAEAHERWEAHKKQVAAFNELAATLPDSAPAESSSSSSYSSETSESGTLSGDESLAALRDKLNSDK